MSAPSTVLEEKKVRFLKWDDRRRTPSDMEFLAGISFKEGKIISQEEESFLIEWSSGERGFHYTTEFEEVNLNSSKDFWAKVDSDEFRRDWLIQKKFTAKRNEDGTIYFQTSRGTNIEANKIRAFIWHDIYTKIYFDRLSLLAALDPDYASTQNSVGFNKFDAEKAHSLFNWYTEKKFWTEQQLLLVIKILHKYRVQIKTLQGGNFITVDNFKGLSVPTGFEEFLDK